MQITNKAPADKRILAFRKLIDSAEIKFYPFSINKLLMTCENEAESNAMVDKMETCLIGVNQGIKNIWYKYSMDDVTKGEINCPINEVDSSRIGFCTALTSALKLSNGLKADEKLMNWYLEDPDRIVKLESDLFSFKNTSYQFNNLNKIQFFDRSTVEYDEVIPVDVVGSFTVNGQEVKKGLPLILPAYQIALFSDYTNEAVNNKAFWLTVNVGSVFMGIGEYRLFLEAGKLIQKSFTAIDIVGNGIGIYAQIANEDAISAELRLKINIASLLSTVPNLLISFTKLSNVVDEIDEVLNQKLYKEENYEGIITKEVEVAKTALKSSQERISENFADEILEIADEGCNFGCKVSKYGCFAGETPIATKAGQKPIKEIQTADTVLTYNHKQKQTAWKVVTAIQKYVATTILSIVMMQGDTLWATPEHPFWSHNTYTAASELNLGDSLFTADGSYESIQQINTLDTSLTVYNFTVEDNQNYYVGERGYLVHNTCFLKKIEESPGLVQAIDNLPTGLKGQFIQDFYEAGEDVIKVLKEKPGCVKAWEGIVNFTYLRKDVDILTSVSKLLDNHPSFMQSQGEKVKSIIDKLGEAGAKCNSCPPHTQNLVKPYMKSIDQHLDDLDYMITNFGNKEGFSGTSSLINEMAASGLKADGGSFLMHYIRNNPSDFQYLSKFEFKYLDGQLNRADVLVGNVKFEIKSWIKGGNVWNDFFAGTGNSYQQFLSYLQNTNNLTDLKYVFNISKSTEAQVKNAFKDLFSIPAKKQEIFNAMTPQLRESILGAGNANRFDIFENKIGDLNSNLYTFIKI